MPEGLEAEIWRTALEALVGRTVTAVEVDQRASVDGIADAIVGALIVGVDRRGKVVVVETDRVGLGLHFGMTGRVVVDGCAPIERLAYASGEDRADWDRLRLWTRPAAPSGEPALRLNDPRRLGRISIDPDLGRLGPDAFTLSAVQLGDRLAGRRAPIKSLLLDQTVVAGLGNLCADEVLFWSRIAPDRPADELSDADSALLARVIRQRLRVMLRRGGSTTGSLDPTTRAGGGPCPRDGAPLVRATIGGRTAVWCPRHQR